MRPKREWLPIGFLEEKYYSKVVRLSRFQMIFIFGKQNETKKKMIINVTFGENLLTCHLTCLPRTWKHHHVRWIRMKLCPKSIAGMARRPWATCSLHSLFNQQGVKARPTAGGAPLNLIEQSFPERAICYALNPGLAHCDDLQPHRHLWHKKHYHLRLCPSSFASIRAPQKKSPHKKKKNTSCDDFCSLSLPCAPQRIPRQPPQQVRHKKKRTPLPPKHPFQRQGTKARPTDGGAPLNLVNNY